MAASCEEFLGKHASGLPLKVWLMKLPELCVADTVIPEFHDACCTGLDSASTMSTVSTLLSNSKAVICGVLSDNASTRSLYVEFCTNTHKEIRTVGESPSLLLFTYILVSILCPIGILVNSLIIMTVLRLKRLHNTTGYCICSLAIADLLVVSTMIVYIITIQFEISMGPRLSLYLLPSLDMFLGSASILHVTLISAERATAVALPFLYPRYLRGKRSILLIKFLWCYCLVLFVAALLRVAVKNEIYVKTVFYLAVLVSFALPFCVIVISYSVIVSAALSVLKKEQKLRRHVVASVMPLVAEYSSEDRNGNFPRDEQESRYGVHHRLVKPPCSKYREIKVTLNVTLLVLPFLFCWTFFVVCNVYEVVSGAVLSGSLNWFLQCLPFLVSCTNPVVYLLFTRSLRKESSHIMQNSILYRKLVSWRRDSVMTNMSLLPSFSSRRSSEQHDEARNL